jgi:hypothetical protein
MKKLLSIMLILFSLSAIADDKKDKRHRIYNITPYCIFDVIPLNSPVKESVARFLIKTPDRFDIDEVSYQVKNSGRIFEKSRAYQKINLVEGPEGKELRINVSKLPPGFYQLLVKVKDHAMFVVDSSLQVPMPDPKLNDKTVAGIDSDGDGIRDDIQRWINEKYTDKPRTKLAVKQLAMGIQLGLVSASDKAQSIIASKKFSNDLMCLIYVVGDEQIDDIRIQLRSKILNTKARHYAEIQTNANFSGQSITIPYKDEDKKARCAFNPDDL